MARINPGFSLVETMISMVLLIALSLTLIQSTALLDKLTATMNENINLIWLRYSVSAWDYNSVVLNKVSTRQIKQVTYVFADMNKDGKDDTWVVLQELPADARYSAGKTVTTISWNSNQTDSMTSLPLLIE